jgi:hypothetical protein
VRTVRKLRRDKQRRERHLAGRSRIAVNASALILLNGKMSLWFKDLEATASPYPQNCPQVMWETIRSRKYPPRDSSQRLTAEIGQGDTDRKRHYETELALNTATPYGVHVSSILRGLELPAAARSAGFFFYEDSHCVARRVAPSLVIFYPRVSASEISRVAGDGPFLKQYLEIRKFPSKLAFPISVVLDRKE